MRRNNMNLIYNDSVTEKVLDEFDGPSAIGKPVGLGTSVSRTALGIHSKNPSAATPGQAMIDLRDRRSMSRLDVMKRASYNN